MKRYTALLALLAVLVPAAAFAGANPDAAILIETGAFNKTTTTCTGLVRTTCASLTFESTVVPSVGGGYAAVYVGREMEPPTPLTVTGIDFGVNYGDGIVVVAWTKCGDLEVPDALWPASGSGNSVVWAEPQIGNVVLIGWFRLTTYAGYNQSISLGINPTFGECRVLDDASTFDALRFPAVGTLDGSVGSQPSCQPTAVKSTTWGGIKSQYRD